MMKCIRLAILALTLLGALIAPMSVGAHPLGNFSVNRYSRIVIGGERLVIYYVVDMAEIPTFQEMQALDADHDGQVSNDEQQQYLARKVDQVRRGLSLEIDEASVELRVTSADLTMPEGQGGLPTLRMEISLTSPLPLAEHESRTLYYRDDNAAQRSGWREIIIFGDTANIVSSTVSTTDVSDALRAYPDHLLGNPLDQREARATFVINGSAAGSASMPGLRVDARSADSGTSISPVWAERFVGQLAGRPVGQASELTEMVSAGRLGPSAMALALLIALIWGGAHALSPGHGKTVVAAYLIGSRGTAWHALYLGLTVTATHTLGIYALGLVTLFASQFLLPENLYPWLALVSGLAVVGVGSTLLVGRARQLGAARNDEHDHHHEHGHDHHHEHEHSHDHGHTHSHLPPGADDRPVTWRSLLVLGIAGGLLPCPSALVLLLGAIALGQTVFGLAMVVSFSVGLAGVLTIIGIALVYARAIVTKVQFGRPSRLGSVGRLLRIAPIGSALIIALIGLAMTIQALSQTGLIQI